MRRTRRTTSSARWAAATSQLTTLAYKRGSGLAYLGDTHATDNTLTYSANSSIDWYYNWSPTPSPTSPCPFSRSSTASTTPPPPPSWTLTIANLPATSTHLLTFNELDGTTSSDGSTIAPSDAAKAYLNDIVPLRSSDEASRT